MIININPGAVAGLPEREQLMLAKLLSVYEKNDIKNQQKNRYYEGNIPLSEVNLGIALPDGIARLEIGCSWGAKCVDVLAARSMFDGFVSSSGQSVPLLDEIVRENNLITEYMKATRDELKIGCTFATLSKSDNGGCRIRFHSPATAAAMWDGVKGRIGFGFAVIDTAPSNDDPAVWTPRLIYLYTDEAVWALTRRDGLWSAQAYAHRMGRPLMEPLVWNATSDKPFGRSRIKNPVRRLIQGYVRTIANATIGLEFSTTPQKYLIGITEDQFAAVTNSKFRQYVGNILAATTNPETGEKPSFGQLTQGNISAHVEMLRTLSAQFSAATGLPVSDTGVVNDANPTSSEAILAQSQTLVSMAEQLNAGNGDALRTIALMAMAVAQDMRLDELPEEQRSVMAHFRNPSMPSVAMTADAAIKIASARAAFAGTDTFLEMIGFSQADIRRINAQELRQRGLNLIETLETE